MGNSKSSEESSTVGEKAVDEELLFHSTCSENIALEAGGKVAIRKESFCKGICFSRRPVRINEKVCLQIVSLSTNWSGFLRIGFTSHDPGKMDPRLLPRYACPDLVNQPGYWAKALPELFSAVNNVISYYVAAGGHVHLLFNQESFGIFFDGVDTNKDLWAMVDIYGKCTGVEIIDDVGAGRSPRLPAALEIPAATPLKFYERDFRQPQIAFHSFCGHNVDLNPERTIASRKLEQYDNGYVFISRALRPNEKVVVQVLTVDKSYSGGLTVGMTSCDPSLLDKKEMPDDADALLDRREYWVVRKDVHVNANCGDELAFSLGSEGELHFSKNGLHSYVILHVDMTIPLWLFLDMYGQIGKLQLYGPVAAAQAVVPTLGALEGSGRPSDASPSSGDGLHLRQHAFDGGGLRVELPPLGHQQQHGDTVVRSARQPTPAAATAAPPPVVPPRISRSASAAVSLPSPTTPGSAAPAVAAASGQSIPPPSSSTADDAVAAGSRVAAAGSDCAAVTMPSAVSVLEEQPQPMTHAGSQATSECVVCFEKACDSVIYTCGHVCMCFACASSMKQHAEPFCPMCRQKIQDVIRIFRS